MKYNLQMERIYQVDAAKALRENPALYIEQIENGYCQKLEKVCETAISTNTFIILVTGPSASGKTTTAKKLALSLEKRGKKVIRISLDNFYMSADKLPFWEDGYQNYESIEGLDIPCFDLVMNGLLETGKAELPVFNFTTGRREERTIPLSFDNRTFLIIEGIHALNPLLYDTLHDYAAIKIYISTHSDFIGEKQDVLLSARDLRLSRRLLRDFYYRGTSAEGTLQMWSYVLRGEELYIRPFREHADVHINSTHGYEPFLYHDALDTLLKETSSESSYYDTTQHLLRANTHFFGIPYNLVPKTSLIQEFIKSNYLENSRINLD